MIRKAKSGAGYTLIEILVVLTIMSILFGFGFGSFRSFSRRQTVLAMGRTLYSDLKLAQEQALSGKKTANCQGDLQGYRFVLDPPQKYRIESLCGGGSSDMVKAVDLGNNAYITGPTSQGYEFACGGDASQVGNIITVANFNPVIFRSLSNGTNIPCGATAAIGIRSTADVGFTANITIGSGGDINYLGGNPVPSLAPGGPVNTAPKSVPTCYQQCSGVGKVTCYAGLTCGIVNGSPTKICYNKSCKNSSTCFCPTPPPIAIPPNCQSSCVNNNDCPGITVCVNISGIKKCVNNACRSALNCICPTPTPSPPPVAKVKFCYSGCRGNSDCGSTLACIGSSCADPNCPADPNCYCGD